MNKIFSDDFIVFAGVIARDLERMRDNCTIDFNNAEYKHNINVIEHSARIIREFIRGRALSDTPVVDNHKSLRDEIAIAVLPRACRNRTPTDAVIMAYKVADAMLGIRENAK